MINETLPIILIAENTSSVESGNVVLFDSEQIIDGNVSTGEIVTEDVKFENNTKKEEYNYGYFMGNTYVTFSNNIFRDIFIVGNVVNIKVGFSYGKRSFSGIVEDITTKSLPVVPSIRGYGFGNKSLVGEYEDSGEDYFILFQAIAGGVLYLIYRDGKKPTDINYLSIFTTEKSNAVTLSSGVPNVSLGKIYKSLMSGNVYKLSKLRIEVLSTLSDETNASIVTKSILYKLQTTNGDCINTPIYPLISVIQQVELSDVDLSGFILNVDTAFVVSSIPAKTMVKYSFYPKEEFTQTGELLRGDTDKDLEVPNLNGIEDTNVEIGSTIAQSVNAVETNDNITKTAEIKENEPKIGNKILLLVAIVAGVTATIKIVKSIK